MSFAPFAVQLYSKGDRAKNKINMSILLQTGHKGVKKRKFCDFCDMIDRIQVIGVLLLTFCLVVSCSRNDPPPPGVLTEAEMVRALEEIYIAEEKVNALGLKRDSAEKVFELFKQKALERHGFSDSVFKKSFNYYWDHPKKIQHIYGVLVDSLNLKEQQSPVDTVKK